MDNPDTDVSLTPTGIAAGLVSLAATLGGLFSLSGPVFSAGVSGLILFGFCRIIVSRQLSRLELSRILPSRARAGESFPVQTIINPGRPLPEEFCILYSDPVSTVMSERAIILTNRVPTSLCYTGKSMNRGPLHPGKWTVQTLSPLGFFSARRTGLFQDSNPLLLLPRPHLPGSIRRYLNRLSPGIGRSTLMPPDPSSEFRLLREFRAGDPVRSIHWPGSLRTGRLQVSELEPPRPRPRSFGLIMHSFEAPGKILTPGTFEMILRIATGLLLRFRNEEIPVVFKHVTHDMLILRNRTLFDVQLDRFAIVGRTPLFSLESLVAAAGEFAGCEEVLVLSDCPKSEWEKAVRPLFRRSTCIDTTSLTRGGGPALARRHPKRQ